MCLLKVGRGVCCGGGVGGEVMCQFFICETNEVGNLCYRAWNLNRRRVGHSGDGCLRSDDDRWRCVLMMSIRLGGPACGDDGG